MSNIEPTEEQWQAARDAYDGPDADRMTEALARLLAEREAKLREGPCAGCDKVNAAYAAVVRDVEQSELGNMGLRKENDTLRARVAELEIYADTAMRNRDAHAAARDELEDREAQHLADIKALRVDLSDAYDELYAVVRYDAGENYGGPYNVDNAERVRAQLARRILATAHYDDAKADAPATCPRCTDDARPVGDGERWVCSVCRRPCRIPLNDAEGGEG